MMDVKCCSRLPDTSLDRRLQALPYARCDVGVDGGEKEPQEYKLIDLGHRHFGVTFAAQGALVRLNYISTSLLVKDT